MASTSVPFMGMHVGLIVRGKTSDSHEPGLLAQHADCVCSTGAPIGFFGEGHGGASSGGSSGAGGSSGRSGGTSGGTGIGLDGNVYDYREMRRKRPFYVDVATARKYNVISGLLRVPVTSVQAKAFDSHWASLDKDPGTFHILGGNCSTAASRAFKKAGILAGGIPGLDTPDNLWAQLRKKFGARADMYFGYISFEPGASGFTVMVTSR